MVVTLTAEAALLPDEAVVVVVVVAVVLDPEDDADVEMSPYGRVIDWSENVQPPLFGMCTCTPFP
ncbi:hypothetical protein PF010_g30823, partial [Phytophthora fragariae]